MTISLSFNDNTYEIPLWTNATEKEWLLSDDSSMDITTRVNNALNILKVSDNVKKLHHYDKFLMLVALREYSYGPNMEEIRSCSCGKTFQISYQIRSNILYKFGDSVSDNLVINGHNVKMKDSEIYSVDDILVEDLLASDYKAIKKSLKEINVPEFKLQYDCKCPYCQIEYRLDYNEQTIMDSIVKKLYNFRYI